MIKNFVIIVSLALMLASCQTKPEKMEKPVAGITEETIGQAVKSVADKNNLSNTEIVEKGVKHAATLWRDSDGTPDDFVKFCTENFIADPAKKEATFYRFSEYFESLFGHFNKITLDLQENVQLMKGEVLPIDPMFAGYSPGAHLMNDLYDNKIAFIVALNFPYYPTEEKNELGADWTPLEWGYSRLGDVFSSRVPSELNLKAGKVSAEGDAYIADYNIYMGNLLKIGRAHV